MAYQCWVVCRWVIWDSSSSLVPCMGCAHQGLQVAGRVKIFTQVPRTFALYKVHTDSYVIVGSIYYNVFCWMCVATFRCGTWTSAPLKFTTYLGNTNRRNWWTTIQLAKQFTLISSYNHPNTTDKCTGALISALLYISRCLATNGVQLLICL